MRPKIVLKKFLVCRAYDVLFVGYGDRSDAKATRPTLIFQIYKKRVT